MKIKNHNYKWWLSYIFGERFYSYIRYQIAIRKYISSRTIFNNLIFKGDKILDIGSNIGGTTYIFSKSCSPSGFVYSFEPNEQAYAYLLNTIEKYELNNVSSFNIAISNEKKLSELITPVFGKFSADTRSTIDKNTINSYSKEGNITNLNSQLVNCDSIDLFVESNNLTVDFIKEDTEGHTSDILQGAMNTINNYFPTLYLEAPHTHKEFGNLKKLGYVLFCEITNNKIKEVFSLVPNEYADRVNSILIHKKKISKFKKIISN